MLADLLGVVLAEEQWVTTSDVIDHATQLLLSGIDSPALRLLAGERPDAPRSSVAELVPAVCTELGIEPTNPDLATLHRVRDIFDAETDGRWDRRDLVRVLYMLRPTHPGLAWAFMWYEEVDDGEAVSSVATEHDRWVDDELRRMMGLSG